MHEFLNNYIVIPNSILTDYVFNNNLGSKDLTVYMFLLYQQTKGDNLLNKKEMKVRLGLGHKVLDDILERLEHYELIEVKENPSFPEISNFKYTYKIIGGNCNGL